MGSGADYRAIQKLGPQDLHLFVINGIATSGKDTFADFVKKILRQEYNYPVSNISSVDKIKEAALLLAWDGAKDEKGRLFLSNIKDMSTSFYDGPMQYMRDQIKKFKAMYGGGVIFLHIREPSEIMKFTTEFTKAKTILMVRDGVVAPNNHADQNAHNFKYHITINNNEGLAELFSKAKKFANDLATGELLQSEY